MRQVVYPKPDLFYFRIVSVMSISPLLASLFIFFLLFFLSPSLMFFYLDSFILLRFVVDCCRFEEQSNFEMGSGTVDEKTMKGLL
jgi:hypothetical protein